MRQTLALIIDAYRELHSRKLFWITLFLSVSIIFVLALFGVNDEGLTFLKFHWKTGFLDPHFFYRAIFISLIVIGIWLSWGAVILALISTAGTFPELLAGGAIDLYLSKPISRLRLFLTKYFTGLLFVTLQLTLFSFGCYLVVGFRAHEWRPSLFLAIPLIVLLFSYVYVFCVLFGVWTRSTVAALLLAILLWLFFSGVQRSAGILSVFRLGLEKTIVRTERDLKDAKTQAQIPSRNMLDLQPGLAKKRTESDEQRLADLRDNLARLAIFDNLVHGLEAIIPKTLETTNMLDRYLLPNEDTGADNDQPSRGPQPMGIDGRDFQAAGQEMQQRARTRSPVYIIGTSLLCELVFLALAAWIFCRRDY
jgi:ABC-type transport system involved in multi-copper enzyme maturation permease subunit